MDDDIDEIKRNVPLEAVLRHLDNEYEKTDSRGNLWYKSPFRNENTASFKIDPIKNTWHDFGRTEKENAHGTNIDLHIDYTNGDRNDKKAISEAIKFLKNFTYLAPRPYVEPEPPKYSQRYKIIKKSEKIWHEALKSHVAWRGLELRHIEHIKQIFIEDEETGNKYNGFYMDNVAEGIEVSIPHPSTNFTFKTCIGPKAPTIIEPTKAGGFKWVVFEGMWDMETWKQMTPNWKEYGMICLNGSGNAGYIKEYIPHADYMYLYMDNDDAGTQAELKLCEDFPVAGSMRHLYDGHKDLSGMWQSKPSERVTLGNKSTNAPRLKF